MCELEVGEVDATRIGSGFFVSEIGSTVSQVVVTAGHVVGEGQRVPRQIRVWAFDATEKSQALQPSSVIGYCDGDQGDVALLRLARPVTSKSPLTPTVPEGLPSPLAGDLIGYSALSNGWYQRRVKANLEVPWLTFRSGEGEPGVSGDPVTLEGQKVAGVYSGKYLRGSKTVVKATAVDSQILEALRQEVDRRERAS